MDFQGQFFYRIENLRSYSSRSLKKTFFEEIWKMETSKKLFGLKAAPLSDSNDSSDVSFEDSGGTISLSIQPNLKPIQPISPIKPSPRDSDRIKSFDDALPKITSILSKFEEIQSIPDHYQGDIFFIPQNSTTDEMSSELARFIDSKDPGDDFNFLVNADGSKEEEDDDDFDILKPNENVLAQIDIVRSSKGKTIDFSKYKIEELDSRIASLVYFILSKNSNREIACFYCLQTLSQLVKNREFAPVSIVFPDYSVKNLFHSLAIHLVTLFPHNPLIESVLYKFSSYDPSAPDAMNLITDDSDEDDDDDSFSDLVAATPSNVIVINWYNNRIVNPLDDFTPKSSNTVTVTVNEPPSTVTYKFSNGNTQLSPNSFTDWILSLNPKKASKHKDALFEKSSSQSPLPPKQGNFLSAMTPIVPDNVLSSNVNNKSVDQDTLINIIEYANQPQILLSYIPNSIDPSLFSLVLPLIQAANSSSVTPLKRGCMYPQIIVNEFDAVQALKNNDGNKLLEVVNDMASRVPKDIPLKAIKALAEKRPFPTISTPIPDNIVAILSLSDLEIALNGRSPLTFERLSREPIITPPFDRQFRACALYHMYSKNSLPPYISFRTAFALAVNLSDTIPDMTSLALSILFEALYGLIDAIPKMTLLECVRNSFLLFGEMLDRLDRYYYSAYAFDAYFLFNPDFSTSSNIAQICQHKGDMVRAVFHLNQTMKLYISTNKADEALYISQVISQIYNDYGMYYDSLSLLTYLLHKPYQISIGRRIEKVTPKRTKTLPPVRRTNTKKPEFDPKPSGTNTLLCGISLADLLIKCQYFKISKSVLDKLHESTDNKLYLRLIDFIIIKRHLRKNNFSKFTNAIPQLTVRTRKNSSGSRLSLLSASTFDTDISTIKLLMTACLTRHLFSKAIFWAEIIIATQTKTALKDIGHAHMCRGEALLNYANLINIQNCPLSVHVPLDSLMLSVGKYKDSHVFHTKTELLAEAAASFKCSRICYGKLGCTRRLIMGTVFYALSVLHNYSIDEILNVGSNKTPKNDDSSSDIFDDKSDDTQIKIEKKNEFSTKGSKGDKNKIKKSKFVNNKNEARADLVIKNPSLEVTPVSGISIPSAATFDKYTINRSNVEEHLSYYSNLIETLSNRAMNPIYIILGEVVISKYNLLQKKVDQSQTRFELAYSNFKKLFTCGGYVIYPDLSNGSYSNFAVQTLNKFYIILENMCHLLLQYKDTSFINKYLLVFDWFNDVSCLLNSVIRTQPKENSHPINSTINVSRDSLESISSPKFPEFMPTIKLSRIDINEDTSFSDDTISHCLVSINANIKLYESQKIQEDEMHEKNRALCKQIESIADKIRQKNQRLIPPETEYSNIKKISPSVSHSIFIHKLFDEIYIYIPESGQKKCIPLSSSKSVAFNVSAKTKAGNDFQFSSSSGIFPSALFEYLSQLLLMDRSNKKLSVQKNAAKNIEISLKKTLFNGVNIDLHPWEKVPDKGNLNSSSSSALTGNPGKGALVTIKTSSKPLIFTTSNDLRFIPFEIIFPQQLVIRCWNFSQLMTPIKAPFRTKFSSVRKNEDIISSDNNTQLELNESKPPAAITKNSGSGFVQPIVLRRRGDFEASSLRSIDLLSYSIVSSGGAFPISPQMVIGEDRSIHYMFPAFLSNKEPTYYSQKYPFCKFIDLKTALCESPKLPRKASTPVKSTPNVQSENKEIRSQTPVKVKTVSPKIIQARPNESESPTGPSSRVLLFIFTYSDMCENHITMRKLSIKYPQSFFMFLPGQVSKEGLKLMKLIFERQKKRISYINDHKFSIELSNHALIARVPFDFITSIQATLIDALNCPVPIICPNY